MAESVLIADADEARGHAFEALLSDLGYRVTRAGSGAEALARLGAAKGCVLLAAGPLPDMEVSRLLRRAKRRCREVVTLAAVGKPAELASLKGSLDGFLPLPLDRDALEVVVRGAALTRMLGRRLRRQRAARERAAERRLAERLETERFLTVKQIVDKLSAFIGQIARDVEGGVRYFNEMPYFVAIHDRKGRVVAANRAFRVMMGKDVGAVSWSIYDGASRSPERCPVGRTLSTANAQESREVVRYRSGARVPVIVHTAPVYNDDGEVELVLEVSVGTRDIDQLREGLRSSQQRYQLIFDAVPCHVAVLDREMRFTATNRHFIAEFGDKTGIPFRDLFFIEEEAFKASPILRTLRDGKPRHGEMVLTAPGGRRANFLVWTSPMATAAGKLMQVLLILLDVTQIRDLQSNLAALGLMIGSISHSIKGVLTGLDAGVYLLNKGIVKRDDSQTASGLDIVRRMVERVRKMILDILFCAKERELQREPVEVQAFAEELAESVCPYFSERGIELLLEPLAPLGVFEVDAGMLRSGVMNVLENAADACAVLGAAHPHRVVLHLEASAAEVGIAVEDNGIGMTPAQLKNLFTIFFSTKGTRGTGLGLFITDRIVRQHGGNITVESSPGRGSRFCIMLPRHPRPAPAADGNPPA